MRCKWMVWMVMALLLATISCPAHAKAFDRFASSYEAHACREADLLGQWDRADYFVFSDESAWPKWFGAVAPREQVKYYSGLKTLNQMSETADDLPEIFRVMDAMPSRAYLLSPQGHISIAYPEFRLTVETDCVIVDKVLSDEFRLKAADMLMIYDFGQGPDVVKIFRKHAVK